MVMDNGDKRLIEDYLPIKAISAEASREKSVRKGHISTLHLWWARRPLVACRAAVYGALVPADQFAPKNGNEQQRKSLGRANAAQFLDRLCKYPGHQGTIEEAQKHILQAHAERLTKEKSEKITVEDILEGRAPRPKVLDMFAGGGAIPLEALRLGCEAHALDLNPVAHIIELCTLVYPQKYGKPDKNAHGMTGPKKEKGETTWGGLAEEVRYWGKWVLEKVREEIGDLYPLIPDPEYKRKGTEKAEQLTFDSFESKKEIPDGYLIPVAYLWTRTVKCKNPSCDATVPLVRQTWLCKKKDRYVALKMVAPPGEKVARFEVVESKTDNGLGFDPEAFSKGGNATCPFCGTVADSRYVKEEGCAKRMGRQMMAIVCTWPERQGKYYLSANVSLNLILDDEKIYRRILKLCKETGLTLPDEPIEANPRSMDTQHFGLNKWSDIFIPRQLLALFFMTKLSLAAYAEMLNEEIDEEYAKAILTYLGIFVDRQAVYNSNLCSWHNTREIMQNPFGRPALPMVWDFAELNPFGQGSGSPEGAIQWIVESVKASFANEANSEVKVMRATATSIPFFDNTFEAIITDPPYYDNVSYSNLSDYFYVWLKRTIGHLYPEHFASELTPKKNEAIMAAYRHNGNKAAAKQFYEDMMGRAFKEAGRVLRSDGPMVCVYAHKTTIGWSTLVDALRKADFTVTEAWPLDTEMNARTNARETASLASSIFIVARKREGSETGSYETEVRAELEAIVRERVDTLWKMGIAGADLIIAAVGAGLRAFTRFAKVEYANGEEVPAEKFLLEVEGVVLETLMEKIFNVSRSGVAAVDGPSRFYVLWRYSYKNAEMDAGEAIVFTYGQNVELDGQEGLSSGSNALVEKKKGKYRLKDFSERGGSDKLGVPDSKGIAAPLIDVLHRTLWLMENQPKKLGEFLAEVKPDKERLRLIAQALSGAGLSGKREKEEEHTIVTTGEEQSALRKLTANWKSLVESHLEGILL